MTDFLREKGYFPGTETEDANNPFIRSYFQHGIHHEVHEFSESNNPLESTLVIWIFIAGGLTSNMSIQVVSVKLDEWTDEQVDLLADSGGNAAVNMRYEAFVPENYTKPRQDCSAEERSDFIRYTLSYQLFILLISYATPLHYRSLYLYTFAGDTWSFALISACVQAKIRGSTIFV